MEDKSISSLIVNILSPLRYFGNRYYSNQDIFSFLKQKQEGYLVSMIYFQDVVLLG